MAIREASPLIPSGYEPLFNAAIAGICANPNFFGPLMQGEPAAAVEFAVAVVQARMAEDAEVPV